MNKNMYVIVRSVGYANDLDDKGYLKLDSVKEIYSVCDSVQMAKEHIKILKDETVGLLESNNDKYKVENVEKGALFIITVDRSENDLDDLRFEIGMKRYKLNALE